MLSFETAPTAAPLAIPQHLARIYRAHITPANGYGAEPTAYVEAFSHTAAGRKIAAAVAALEGRLPEAVQERIYNVSSARELIDGGVSDDIELRLFENGWGQGGTRFVESPLFLLTSPALIRKWAQICGVQS